MTAETTAVHRGPRKPAGPPRRSVLVCAFPRAQALPLPDSGVAVGRAWLRDNGLTDSEVSSEHLRFDRAGGALGVVDLDSRNGTWVNGVQLRPQRRTSLPEGALIRIGRTLFVVSERLAGPLEPAPPIGALVGPYGLREVARCVAGLAHQQASNILIQGETGVGKELLARAIAEALERAEPYCPVNVASLSDGVFEAQLFGHVAGAFSGAKNAAPGLVIAHQGGTLFLDEIGELSLEMQAKLLRLSDNREVLAVGAARPQPVDILIIAATNRNLEEMIAAGSFRADLYARLARALITIPPLRKRRMDIFAIAQAVTAKAGAATLSADNSEVEALEYLMRQPWPRNVRQLTAALEAAQRLDKTRGLAHWSLKQALPDAAPAPAVLTDELVDKALAQFAGNVSQAAQQLGVSRGKLIRFQQKKTDGRK